MKLSSRQAKARFLHGQSLVCLTELLEKVVFSYTALLRHCAETDSFSSSIPILGTWIDCDVFNLVNYKRLISFLSLIMCLNVCNRMGMNYTGCGRKIRSKGEQRLFVV